MLRNILDYLHTPRKKGVLLYTAYLIVLEAEDLIASQCFALVGPGWLVLDVLLVGSNKMWTPRDLVRRV